MGFVVAMSSEQEIKAKKKLLEMTEDLNEELLPKCKVLLIRYHDMYRR